MEEYFLCQDLGVINRVRRVRRQEDIMDTMLELDFIKNFRMNKNGVQTVTNRIANMLQRDNRGASITPLREVHN